MATHQREESNQTQFMADDTVEECTAHTIDSELAARNLVHKQHLVHESASETFGRVIDGITLTSNGACVHTCGVKRKDNCSVQPQQIPVYSREEISPRSIPEYKL